MKCRIKPISGYVEYKGVSRRCLWIKFSHDYSEYEMDRAAESHFQSEDLSSVSLAFWLHPNTKWCSQFGWSCEEEGYRHTHWEPITGDPTHKAYWRIDIPREV